MHGPRSHGESNTRRVLPSAAVAPDWTTDLDRGWRALERWRLPEARDAAEKIRSLAAGWGDIVGVGLANVLLARTALLTLSDPARRPSVAAIPDARNATLIAATLRFEAELAVATGAALPDLPELRADRPVDMIAAAAILAAARLADPARNAQRIVGAATIADRADAAGWQVLVDAGDREANGGHGLANVERALLAAEREENRALAWTALGIRATLCGRRGARDEERASRERMRSLIEGWALTLSTADAAAALARPDRTELYHRNDAGGETASSSRLVAVAL